MEGLEDRLGLWFRRMSTAPTTSESMATSKASVACEETKKFSQTSDQQQSTSIPCIRLFSPCERVDLAAMFQEKLQDVQILVLDSDGDGIPAQHVHAVDVELAVSVLLEQLLHHVVVTWVKKKKRIHSRIHFREVLSVDGGKQDTHKQLFLRTHAVLAEAGWAPALL